METTKSTWRLIDTGSLGGFANMATDEALLNCFDAERSAPILRLYGWEPPALSLGRFQKASELLDIEKCSSAGVEIVQRITGGGVIYHASELTYAIVCAPRHVPPAASIKDSFRILTAFLLGFYHKLGLPACYAVDRPSVGIRLGARTTFCFAGRENYDIVVEDKKIGGNAQRRQKNIIFQHGSIPLTNFSIQGAGFLRQPPEDFGETVAALADFGITGRCEELKALLAEAFSEALPARLAKDSLTDEERRETALLLSNRHRSLNENRD